MILGHLSQVQIFQVQSDSDCCKLLSALGLSLCAAVSSHKKLSGVKIANIGDV